MCIYIYIYMYMHTSHTKHIHINTHIYIYIYIYIYTPLVRLDEARLRAGLARRGREGPLRGELPIHGHIVLGPVRGGCGGL